MKVVNTSDQPYEFTFDSGNYGPYKSGQVVDLPDDVAKHGIRRSMILDPLEGYVAGYKFEPLSSIETDRREGVAMYSCALVAIGECAAQNFKTVEELMAHLRTHQKQKP